MQQQQNVQKIKKVQILLYVVLRDSCIFGISTYLVCCLAEVCLLKGIIKTWLVYRHLVLFKIIIFCSDFANYKQEHLQIIIGYGLCAALVLK